eukprot:8762807-Alexandrium_andersonii.AAC.1
MLRTCLRWGRSEALCPTSWHFQHLPRKALPPSPPPPWHPSPLPLGPPDDSDRPGSPGLPPLPLALLGR